MNKENKQILQSINERVLARASLIKKQNLTSTKEIKLQNNIDYYFKLGTDYTIEFANHQLCKLVGYAEHEIIGLSSEIFVHPNLPNCLYEQYITNLFSKEPFEVISKIITKDRNYFWLRMHFNKKINANGEIESILVHGSKINKKNTKKLTDLYRILSKTEEKTGDTIASKKYLEALFEDLDVSFDEYISSFCEDETEECIQRKEKVKKSKPIITKRIVAIRYNPDLDMYH